MVAFSLGTAGGQAPQPLRGAPQAQGLRACWDPSHHSGCQSATRSDTVRQIKSRILQLSNLAYWLKDGVEGSVANRSVTQSGLCLWQNSGGSDVERPPLRSLSDHAVRPVVSGL